MRKQLTRWGAQLAVVCYLLLAGNIAAQAQATFPYNWQWDTSLAASNILWGRALARDAAGNLYVTGWYRGTGTLGTVALPPVSGSLTSLGLNYGLYLAKLTATGTVQWVKQFDGPGQDGGMRVATDAAGNVFVSGRLTGPQAIGSSRLPGGATGETPYAFVAKFTTDGEAQWAVQGPEVGQLDDSWDKPTGLAVDAAGNAYAAINGITKLSPTGAVVWQTPTTNVFTLSLAIGSQGQVLAGGYFNTTAVLGAGTSAVTLTAVPPYADGFTAQLTSAGEVQWVQPATGPGSDIFAKDVTTDAAGNVYVMGNTNGGGGTVQLGATMLTNPATYLAKYTTAGAPQWANAATPGLSYAMSAATDAGGTTYLGGNGQLVAFNSAGTLLSSRTDNLERLFGLVLSGAELYVAGNYSSRGGLAGAIALPATGATQGISGFVGKLGSTVTAARSPGLQASWAICPNPARDGRLQLVATKPLAGTVEVSLLSATGQKVRTATVPAMAGNWQYEWNLQGVPGGIYSVQLRADAGTTACRLVLE